MQICPTCGDPYERTSTSFRCMTCRTNMGAEQNRRRRLEAVAAYGGRCACCGESELKFLGFDHVNGHDGKREPTQSMLMRLKRQGWPKEDIQLLCHNCNLAKGFYGQCPHPNGVQGGPRSGRPRSRV